MKISFENIENFFKYDLEIKKLMHDVDIPFDCDYRDDYVSKYADKLYGSLQTFQYYFVRIANDLKMSNERIEHINNLFNEYNRKLLSCGTDFDKLSKFYTENIGGMREVFVDKVKECCGYTMDRGMETFYQAKTINELLHFLHHSIVNNEEYYQSMPQIAQKNNNDSYPITLYGKENEVSRKIYDNFPLDLDVAYTDILSLKDKILIMVRDRGHALTIEVNVRENECDVSYFIPKICNTLMVNNLRGVRNVDENSKFTVGEFRNNNEDIVNAIYDFISKVPTDNDMFIEGGAFYEHSRSR